MLIYENLLVVYKLWNISRGYTTIRKPEISQPKHPNYHIWACRAAKAA